MVDRSESTLMDRSEYRVNRNECRLIDRNEYIGWEIGVSIG